ncbi:hypothetical protein M406DRAFT_66186 [Cryphonectria parasitica EP155]|uniref:Uncharacterized protein n=1 Tax=Cryphonectria parasitica (strain ATCC 38755 / EP155) TaxID=660469 RepID=A0A9P5CU32_CRYP1|nr:uncharacterized protein M406DRAFT_66186 [Cryphonectria parasitica EP155]KAF3769715.1 hypothetical protein M406DRAFT_66186 [Cryphonectria parasitica EP155]
MTKPTITTLEAPIAILPRYVAQKPTTLHLKGHLSSFSGGDFTITDETPGQPPREVFSTDAQAMSMREKRVLLDASRQPLFAFQRKVMSMLGTWYILLPEQTVDAPAARFEVKWSMGSKKIDAFIAKGDGTWQQLKIRGQSMWKSRTDVFLGESNVAIMSANKKKWALRQEWTVDVAQGMDTSLASAIIVVLAAIEQNANAASSS